MHLFRRIPLFALAILLTPAISSAQRIIGPELEQIPPSTQAFHASAIANMTPAVRSWIKAQVALTTQATTSSAVVESRLRTSIATRFKGQSLRTEHADALLAVILTESINATHAEFEDTRFQAREIEKLLAELDALRKELGAARDETASLRSTIACSTPECIRANICIDSIRSVQRKTGVAPKLTINRITTLDDLSKAIANFQDQRDSLAELGEEQQLRMQLMMERMQRAMQALSNIMKKLSDTASQIIANLK